MKSRIVLILSLLAVFSFPTIYAISANDPANTAANATSSQAQAVPQQLEGEIIAFLIVVNKDEIAAAKEALKRNVNPTVKKYARNLLNDHSKNLHDTLKVSHKTGQKPVENDEIANMKENGKTDLATLKPMKSKEFQVAYIDLMVKGHEAALNKIDQVTPNVTNPDLKKHLEKTREAVAKHLEKAKEIQTKLSQSA